MNTRPTRCLLECCYSIISIKAWIQMSFQHHSILLRSLKRSANTEFKSVLYVVSTGDPFSRLVTPHPDPYTHACLSPSGVQPYTQSSVSHQSIVDVDVSRGDEILTNHTYEIVACRIEKVTQPNAHWKLITIILLTSETVAPGATDKLLYLCAGNI